MTIPTQQVLTAAADAFRNADLHIKACDICRPDMRLPELCETGRRFTLDAATVLDLPTAGVVEPLSASTAQHFEQGVRDQVHAELVYYADRMETAQPTRADVLRDAHEVRRAARVARDGLGANLFKGCLDEDQARHMDELHRLRVAAEDERALRFAAEDWADLLAYKVAPAEVIGRHDVAGAYPWGSALDLLTPAAEVTALRAQLIALQNGGEAPADLGDSWTAERAAQIRTLVGVLAAGDDYGTREPMSGPVETEAAIEAATVLQLRVDCLERRVRDLQRDAEAAPPDRMPVLRPEFFESASADSIKAAIKRGRMNETRWNNRLATLERLLEERLAQIEAGTWPAGDGAPAAGVTSTDPGQCPQNRTGTFIRITDPVLLGPHFYQTDDLGLLRCTWCDTAAHWGGEPLAAPKPPVYVHNAMSVNRTAKHLVDPEDPTKTRCPKGFVASDPIDPEDAALLALCGGCRRAVTGEQG